MANDFFNNIFNQQQNGSPTKLHEEKETVVIKELDKNAAFEKTETVLVDQDGPSTVKTRSVHLAGCGHYVGMKSQTELTGNCEFCGATLCYRCSNLRCVSCLKVGCASCLDLKDEKRVLCKSCTWKERAKKAVTRLHTFLCKEVL